MVLFKACTLECPLNRQKQMSTAAAHLKYDKDSSIPMKKTPKAMAECESAV